MKKFQEMLMRQEDELQAVRRSAESSKGGDKTGPENSHQAPQNKPDMMAYREGGDTLMIDGESDTSDELGWQALTEGKMWEESDKEIEIDEDFDGGGGSRLKSADIARGNSPNRAHGMHIGVDSEDEIVEIVSPELGSGLFC